jgi:hypothetical protein
VSLVVFDFLIFFVGYSFFRTKQRITGNRARMLGIG